jgi:hypothetical protein
MDEGVTFFRRGLRMGFRRSRARAAAIQLREVLGSAGAQSPCWECRAPAGASTGGADVTAAPLTDLLT